MADLSSLPPPDIVETLDYENLLAAYKAELMMRYPEIASVLDLESEPIVKLMEVAAYREMLLRARINDAARSNLLALATDGDLDHLAAFYGVARLPDEQNDRLRLRTQLRIAAMAGNGTAEQYRFTALTASLAVVDAAPLRPAAGSIDLALWIAAGAAVDATLAAVRAAFAAPGARILGVPLTVRQAHARPVDVIGTIYREAAAPVDLAERLAAELPQAIADYAQLGRDMPRSWLLARLHVAGVSRVALAASVGDVTLAPDEYATAGTITLADGGIAW